MQLAEEIPLNQNTGSARPPCHLRKRLAPSLPPSVMGRPTAGAFSLDLRLNVNEGKGWEAAKDENFGLTF